jgi:hypothetical protein
VDIRVEPTDEGFLVSVRSQDVADATEIVARAKAFTTSTWKRSVVDAGLGRTCPADDGR